MEIVRNGLLFQFQISQTIERQNKCNEMYSNWELDTLTFLSPYYL